jgi:hypothetical protein
MNTQLCLNKTAIFPGSDESIGFTASLSPDGVKIEVAGPFVPRTVQWHELEDVEFLASLFWDAQVWEFREIIKLLAEAKNMRHLFP